MKDLTKVVYQAEGKYTEDYKFLAENPHLGNRVELLCAGGSHAYGTAVETSDVDIRGFAMRTAQDIVLGRDFEQVVNEATDTTVYSFDKVVHLLTQCNPNVIEMLGLRHEHYLYLSYVGEKLLQNKQLFLSKKCINTFGGYANQQMYRLQQKSLSAMPKDEYNKHTARVLEQMVQNFRDRYGITEDQIQPYVDEDGVLRLNLTVNGLEAEKLSGVLGELNKTILDYSKPSKRNKKALTHNKIAKHSMHLLRLYMMAVDLLEKQEIITYREDEHDLLMSVRNGEYLDTDGRPSKAFFEIVSEYEAKFDEAKVHTQLPDEPNYAKIDEFRGLMNMCIVV